MAEENAPPPVAAEPIIEEVEEEEEKSENLEELFNKRTTSFRCLAQVLVSRSSLLRNPLFQFPPLEDLDLDGAFNYVEPPEKISEVGVDKYLACCKKFGTSPLRAVVDGLKTPLIDLEYYSPTEYQIRAIVEGMKHNKFVKEFVLSSNHLTSKCGLYLANMLKTNTTLTILNLQECRIGSEGAKYLNTCLEGNKTLKELNLNSNNLGNEGLKLLQKGLMKNKGLFKLDLGNNNFGEEGAEALGEVFTHNNTIKELNVAWNKIFTSQGSKALFNGMCENTSLRSFNIAWNAIEVEPVTRYLAKFLKKAPLEHLDVSSNRITGEPFEQVFGSVTKISTLLSLNFGNNPLTPEEATMLLCVPERCRRCKHLNMENIFCSKSDIAKLTRFKNQKKTVIIGGILKNYTIKGPDYIKLLFDRANFLALKNKGKIFGHFILSLPDKTIEKTEYEEIFATFGMNKVDVDLLNGIAAEFVNKKGKLEIVMMKESFTSYFPDVELPKPKLPPPTEEEQAGEKSETTNLETTNLETANLETANLENLEQGQKAE